MRGSGDHLTIGERVAFYRGRRTMSQRTLGDLVGRSEDWVSKIERGVRKLRRVDVIADLARALRVEIGDLLGQPVLAEDELENDDIPAIRDALMTPRRLSRTLFASPTSETKPISAAHSARVVENVWRDYQEGKLGRVIAELPDLITTAQNLEDLATGARREGWAVSARTHHLMRLRLGPPRWWSGWRVTSRLDGARLARSS